jgi:tripartite-type tricarboxylate transporter receptor subunit TctC
MTHIKRERRLHFCSTFLVAALALAFATPLHAQSDFPNRPIRLINTAAAGGTGDTIARVVAKLMGAMLNVSIVVDNRPGATGMIATETVVRAEPNGYTLLQTSSSLITNAATGRKLPYDVLKDLTAVSNLATADGYLVLVHPGLAVTSVKELIALARKRSIPYGSPGMGNPIHLHTEAFALRAGIKLHHVPYKGLAPALTALLSGEVQLVLAPPIATKAHVDAGRMHALAVVSHKRTAVLPDLPTMEELGFKGFYLLGGWQGLFAPAALPPRVLERLHGAAKQAVGREEFRSFAHSGGYVAVGSTPAEFRKQIAAEFKGFQDIAKLIDLEKS